MSVKSHESRIVSNEEDIATVRASIKRIVALLNFSLINQTKVVTAASELVRNILEHGKGGNVKIELLDEPDRVGVRMIFEDNGSGIPDVEKALEDGFTTGKGMGLGLGGAKRLMDEFHIESKVDQGTRVAAIKWNPKV